MLTFADQTHATHPIIQKLRCIAIWSLVIGDEGMLVEIRRERGSRRARDGMRGADKPRGQVQEHAGVQEMGCAALTNLAAKNNDSRDEIGKQVV
jgi:hypothetical protein